MHNAFLMSTTYLLTHAPSLHWRRRDPEIVIFLDFNFSFSDGLWQVGSHGEWFEANFLASILTDTKSSISSIPSSFYLPFFNVGKAKRLGEPTWLKFWGEWRRKLVFYGSKLLELNIFFAFKKLFLLIFSSYSLWCFVVWS